MRAGTFAVSLLFLTTPGEDVALPPNLNETQQATLEHGLALLREGDLAFARGHFEGARLPRPCLVFLDLLDLPSEDRLPYAEAAARAMGLWNEAFPEELRFEAAVSPEATTVTVRFPEEVHASAEKAVAGNITCRAPHVGKKVVPTFQVQVASKAHAGGSRSPASITHVVAHELGHAIGIGDSPDRDDIMGPDSAQPSVRLSPRDLRAARTLLDVHRALLRRVTPEPGP